MSKPTIKNGPASQYAAPSERIVEFFDSDIRAGGLISLHRVGGKLHVHVYRCDPDVVVHVPANAEPASCEEAASC